MVHPIQKVTKALLSRYIAIFISTLFFFILPFLYRNKMESGMEKTDLYLIWLVGLACWVGLRYKVLQRKDLLLGAGVLLGALISVILVKNDTNSFKILITLFFSLGVYFYICQRPALLPGILLTIAPSFIYQLLLGWWQFFHFGNDPLMVKGSFFNSGYFANWLAPCTVLFLSQMSKIPRKGPAFTTIFKNILRIVFCMALLLLCITGARSAIFGALAGFSFFAFRRLRQQHPGRHYRLFMMATVFVAVIMCVGFFAVKKDSTLGRLTIYKVSMQMIADHPLTGVGANRFPFYYNQYQARYFQAREQPVEIQLRATNTFEAFNFLLQLLAEYGLIGFILAGVFFINFIRRNIIPLLKQNAIQWQHGCLASLVCIFCSGLFSNPFHCSVVFMLFILLLAGARQQEVRVAGEINIKKANIFFLISKWILVASGIFFIYFGANQWTAEKKWKKASMLARFGSFELARPLYDEAYVFLKNDGSFLYNYGTESAQAEVYGLSIYLLENAKNYNSFNNLYTCLGVDHLSMKNYAAGEQAFLYAIHIVPAALLPKYYLIHLYLAWGHKSEARQWLTYTLNYPVKVKDDFTDSILGELASLKIE